MPRIDTKQGAVCISLALAALIVLSFCAAGSGWLRAVAAGEAPVRVVVECGKPGGEISPLLFGANTANWDEQLFPGKGDEWPLTFDQKAVTRIREAGLTFLRYPGGRDCDDYFWNDPQNSPLRMDTDEFMVLCRLTGATPSITVNYTAGPEAAAEWVRYTNLVKGYRVRYWEIGDEEYFLVGAEAYAERLIAFAKAMKAVDPAIAIGANITPSRLEWSRTVLQKAGGYIDFVVYNWYPQEPNREDDSLLFATPPQLARNVALIRKLIRETKPDRAERIELHIGGYNSVSYAPGPQTTSTANALWLADVLGTMATAGVDAAGFWALHNVYPPRKGDYGLIGSTPENIPYPTFRVFQLFKGRFTGNCLAVETGDPRVTAYAAVSQGRGRLCVILINKAGEEIPIRLELEGAQAAPRGEVWVVDSVEPPRRMEDFRQVDGVGMHRLPKRSVTAVVLPLGTAGIVTPRNLALGRPVTVSSTAEVGGAFGPESAVDGNPSTRWASRIWRKTPEWFQIDLGSPSRIGTIVLNWELAAVQYTLAVSVDGKEWHKIFETAAGKGGREVIRFTPQEARYIRLDLLARPREMGTRFGHSLWTTWGFSLWEFEVYGPDQGTG